MASIKCICGTSGDQARFATDLLVLAFIEDDLRRMQQNAFLTKNPKPRLLPRGNAVTVGNVPVPTWGRSANTGWFEEFPNRTALVQILRSVYDTFLQDYDPVPVAERAFVDLNRLSREKRQPFALAYLASRSDLASDQPTATAAHFQEFAARDHIPFFGLTDSLKTALKQQSMLLFDQHGIHYSEAGNKVIAKSLLDQLRNEFPEVPR